MGFNGEGLIATLAELNRPNSATLDAYGNIYIADSENDRIRRINYNPILVSNISNESVAIYPNPSHKELHITANQPIKVVIIINMFGQVILETTSNDKEITLTIQHLPVGMYTVKANGVYLGRFRKE